MKKGMVARVFDYYFNPEQAYVFGPEILRALDEFLDSQTAPTERYLVEEMGGHFNEWFLYDFKMADGRTPLGKFYATNPLGLSEANLSFYKGLEENVFDFFEIEKVFFNKGMVVRGLVTGKRFEVSEKTATRDIRKKDVLLCRVIKAGDHFEIAGGSVILFPLDVASVITSDDKFSTANLSPKFAYQLIMLRRMVESGNSTEQKIKGSAATLVSGSLSGSHFKEDDNCPVCQVMRKAKAEGREPTEKELEGVFTESKTHDGSRPDAIPSRFWNLSQ